jgi:hypothetical protein
VTPRAKPTLPAGKGNYEQRATFIVRLRAEKGVDDPVRALRALLKIASRKLGLRAVSVEEEGRR